MSLIWDTTTCNFWSRCACLHGIRMQGMKVKLFLLFQVFMKLECKEWKQNYFYYFKCLFGQKYKIIFLHGDVMFYFRTFIPRTFVLK